MRKSFTLIELGIIILVISVIAGIFLRNVGYISAKARDIKRVQDLKNVQVYLEQYYIKFGTYPMLPGDPSTAEDNWKALETILKDAGIVAHLPKPPKGSYYSYFECCDNSPNGVDCPLVNNKFIFNKYLLYTRLEESMSENPRLYESGVEFFDPNGNLNSPLNYPPPRDPSQTNKRWVCDTWAYGTSYWFEYGYTSETAKYGCKKDRQDFCLIP